MVSFLETSEKFMPPLLLCEAMYKLHELESQKIQPEFLVVDVAPEVQEYNMICKIKAYS